MSRKTGIFAVLIGLVDLVSEFFSSQEHLCVIPSEVRNLQVFQVRRILRTTEDPSTPLRFAQDDIYRFI